MKEGLTISKLNIHLTKLVKENLMKPKEYRIRRIIKEQKQLNRKQRYSRENSPKAVL